MSIAFKDKYEEIQDKVDRFVTPKGLGCLPFQVLPDLRQNNGKIGPRFTPSKVLYLGNTFNAGNFLAKLAF